MSEPAAATAASPHETLHERAVGPLPTRSGPLTDVRVIDLTQALSGPFCTMLLADLGADVIKVEPPTGDFTRSGGPFTKGDSERNYGGYFASVNRSKRSIVLDLNSADDRETLFKLVETADVVVENYRVGVMDKLGVGYDALAEINPRIVYGAVRGFGDPRTGHSPYEEWPAFDVVAQAMSGLVATTGEPGTSGVRVGPSIGDTYPATLLALGIVAAVHEARNSGKGQFVDVAMYDALVALCEETIYRYSYWGRPDTPNGNVHPIHIPFGIFPTADGACALAAPTTHWPILCELIGRPELATDERTNTNRARNANRAFITEIIEAVDGRANDRRGARTPRWQSAGWSGEQQRDAHRRPASSVARHVGCVGNSWRRATHRVRQQPHQVHPHEVGRQPPCPVTERTQRRDPGRASVAGQDLAVDFALDLPRLIALTFCELTRLVPAPGLSGSSHFLQRGSSFMSSFPNGFLWGAAGAGHQIEGGNVNADLWPQEWAPGSHFAIPSGDACDSYHRYGEDIALLADAGLNTYRFGIEWSRIEPEEGFFSRAALDHYRRMLAACHERGVTPIVTYNHFTTPRWFAASGGWSAAEAPDRFAKFCRTCHAAPR